MKTYSAATTRPGTVAATLPIEYDEEVERKERLTAMVGIQDHVFLEVGDLDLVQVVLDDGQYNTERVSAVQFIQIPVSDEVQAALGSLSTPARLVCTHPEYTASVALPNTSSARPSWTTSPRTEAVAGRPGGTPWTPSPRRPSAPPSGRPVSGTSGGGPRSSACSAACSRTSTSSSGAGTRGAASSPTGARATVVLPIVAVPLGWFAWRLFGKKQGSAPKTWIHLAFWGLITHPLLDVCTTYGSLQMPARARLPTALRHRLRRHPRPRSTRSPCSSPSCTGAMERRRQGASMGAGRAGLGLLYLLAGLGVTQVARGTFQAALADASFQATAIRTPVPFFFNLLRHGAARDAEGRIAVTTIVPWSVERTRGET